MELNNLLHKISHIKWLFFVIEVVLIAYCFIALPDNLITYIGVLIFITGIHLGLDSLSDIEKMSVKEFNKFRNASYARGLFRFILLMIALLVIISLLFFSLKFFGSERNQSLFNEFFNLGLNLWALILGLFCVLKNVNDKQKYVLS